MNLKQKEIVLLPFPFTDQEGNKVRPAVVISNDHFNKRSEDCIMVPLTTVIKDTLYSIIIDQENMGSGKLLKPSIIRVDKVFSIEKKLAAMKIGRLNDTTFKKIKNKFTELF